MWRVDSYCFEVQLVIYVCKSSYESIPESGYVLDGLTYFAVSTITEVRRAFTGCFFRNFRFVGTDGSQSLWANHVHCFLFQGYVYALLSHWLSMASTHFLLHLQGTNTICRRDGLCVRQILGNYVTSLEGISKSMTRVKFND